jgi:hypothetical protein
MQDEMAGERSLGGVLAGAGGGSGAGVPGLLALLLAMEAGVPVPVPSDLVMLLLGERVSAGALPLWLAAAGSGIRVGRALPALVLGSSLFLQAHLLLGYALGPAARELLERARLPVLVVAGVALAAAAVLLLRRGRPGRATRVLAEGAARPAWPSASSARPASRPRPRSPTRPTPATPTGPERPGPGPTPVRA